MGLINNRGIRPDLKITIYTDGIVIRTYTKAAAADMIKKIRFTKQERDIVIKYMNDYIEENKHKIEIEFDKYNTISMAFDM